MEFLVCDKDSVDAGQLVVDCRFNIEQGKGVAKVLSVCAKPYLTNCESVDGEVRYSGKVCFKLIYLSEENEVVSCENISEFNEESKNELIKESSKNYIEFKLVDVTTPSVKTNEVRVACVLDSVLHITCNDMKKYDDGEQDDICTKKEVVDIWENIEYFDETFDIVDEIKIKDNLDRIICHDVNVCVKDSFASIAFVCVSGDVTYSFVYEKDVDGEKQLCHFTQTLPFKQEMSLSESKKECFFNVGLNVNTSDIKVNVVLDGETNIIKFTTPVRAHGELYENKIVDCVSDAYMEEYDTQLINENFKSITNLSKEIFESVESGSFELGGDGEYSLIGYTAQNVTLTNVVCGDNETNIEGLISVNVLLSYEGGLTSINCEYPFKSKFNLNKNKFLNASLSLNGINVSLADKLLNVECRVGCLIFCYDKFAKSYVCKIEKLEQKQKPDCALEIVFVKENQTLFDVGKEFSVSEKMLLEQNKDINLPLKEGDKLVIYRQKIVDFN